MLRTLCLTTCLTLAVLAVLAVPTSAQEPDLPIRRENLSPHTTESSHGTVPGTPEMWFYEQERQRKDDPQQAVRRRAEQQANERRARIASAEWYGIYNLRPDVSASPTTGNYAPLWSGNPFDPQLWRPYQPSIISNTPLYTSRPAPFVY